MLAPVTPATYTLLGGIWIAVAAIVFVTLLFLSAPYGRHHRPGWGPAIPARRAWMLMELPAPLLVGSALAGGARPLDTYSLLLGGMFLAHYTHRALIFPLRLPSAAQPMPASIVASAIVFNLVNGSFLGLWLGWLAPATAATELSTSRLIIGVTLYLVGAAVNLQSDAILRRLRPPGTTGYRVPTGGLFRLVSCPNYLGEIVEWSGFALVMWALPGWAFLAWTAANLVPRALAHHRWYHAAFPDYPAARRALVPYLL